MTARTMRYIKCAVTNATRVLNNKKIPCCGKEDEYLSQQGIYFYFSFSRISAADTPVAISFWMVSSSSAL